MKIRNMALFSLCVFMILSMGCKQKDDYDIIIYGGGPQAVSTALKASSTTNDKARILMIVPEPVLGSTLTHGRQNLFDLNYYKPSQLPAGFNPNYLGAQGGSMYYFLNDLGSVFDPDTMASYFHDKIAHHKNITVLHNVDIVDVGTSRGGKANPDTYIESITMRKIAKAQDGTSMYMEGSSAPLTAKIFVDASESGKLTRLSGTPYTVGREDQGQDTRQMVATLMYKIKGVNPHIAIAVQPKPGTYGIAISPQGLLQFWAGNEAYTIPDIVSYGKADHPFRIKGYNAGQTQAYTGKMDTLDMAYWMNQFLIYNVDGRKVLRDQATKLYPERKDTLDTETARLMAIQEIAKPEFIAMIRKLPGFEKAQIVTAPDGKPVVGDMLYIRETIHTDRGTGKHAFALSKEDVLNGSNNNYNRRIGLGYYQFDSNSYTKNEQLSQPRADQPWYVPYEALVPKQVHNLLIPGYAASIDSFTWTAMRVYPNLIMLGDAAGVTAGLAYRGKVDIMEPTKEQMILIQDGLRKAQAILER